RRASALGHDLAPGRRRRDPDGRTRRREGHPTPKRSGGAMNATRSVAVGCPRWPIVAHDLPPDAPAAIFFANRVVTASVEAVACGVKKGMRRREAQARCPDIEVLTHDPARDARSFEPIASAVEAFGPRVEIVRPGLCVLAARGPARYFGGEDALRSKLADAIDDAIAELRSNELHLDDRTRVGIA